MKNSPTDNLQKSVCAITGASGYVGSRIKMYFERQGWEVLQLGRQPNPGTAGAAYYLGGDLPIDALAGVKSLVHCAYDFRPHRWDEIRKVNVQGTQSILQTARKAGVEKLICISSISAFPGCQSLYGKAKLEIEQAALANGALVIRPGLVYGDRPEAMFGKLVAQVRKSRILPLFGTGSQVQYLVHDEDLAAFILSYAEQAVLAPTVPVTAAHEHPWTFRSLLTEIGRGLGREPRFICLPWRLIWAGLKAAESCGLPVNFRSDSLVSLMNQNPKPDFSGNASLDLKCRPFEIEKVELV